MERSTDPATRFNGGDLGYFTTDVMPEAYDGALKGVKVGDVVGPFQIENGWAIVKVEDRRDEQPITLEAARPQIVRFLTYDQIRDLLEKLRARAKLATLIGPAQDVPGRPREPASAPPPQKSAAAPLTGSRRLPPVPAQLRIEGQAALTSKICSPQAQAPGQGVRRRRQSGRGRGPDP